MISVTYCTNEPSANETCLACREGIPPKFAGFACKSFVFNTRAARRTGRSTKSFVHVSVGLW